MGITSENVAERYGISRQQQDKLSMESHEKALRAQRDGLFKDEIVPLKVYLYRYYSLPFHNFVSWPYCILCFIVGDVGG